MSIFAYTTLIMLLKTDDSNIDIQMYEQVVYKQLALITTYVLVTYTNKLI